MPRRNGITHPREFNTQDSRILVRDARREDAAGVAAIAACAFPATYEGIVERPVFEAFLAQSYGADALRDCIDRCAGASDAHFLVAESEGTTVGYLHFDCAGDEPELHRIYVEPSVKRGGIGSALLHELHRRLAPGASYVLMVLEHNTAAVAFYARHGFVVERRVDAASHLSRHTGVTFREGISIPGLILRFRRQPAR